MDLDISVLILMVSMTTVSKIEAAGITISTQNSTPFSRKSHIIVAHLHTKSKAARHGHKMNQRKADHAKAQKDRYQKYTEIQAKIIEKQL